MDHSVNKTAGILMISSAQGKLMDQRVNKTDGIAMIFGVFDKAKSGSGFPGSKNEPRGTKSISFA